MRIRTSKRREFVLRGWRVQRPLVHYLQGAWMLYVRTYAEYHQGVDNKANHAGEGWAEVPMRVSRRANIPGSLFARCRSSSSSSAAAAAVPSKEPNGDGRVCLFAMQTSVAYLVASRKKRQRRGYAGEGGTGAIANAQGWQNLHLVL
ncbi:hypothetical protein COCCADRAFT_100524 [Bipolaris zeicola 26-R-13]|uniref:Uncharacterized protein n=1 Tax=Cochliobolus carbonum (strain 26-R-13) TaxID=930089 RepID=W6YKD4_COCC2|nr:uncharacterized protein COCCADRAFT_100524 [Bipolaris zeicola 26-R-13]EUC31746.1 hypothetical protein COCCADRAFT_100524 [Bipolaris zeicola 26-R-13]